MNVYRNIDRSKLQFDFLLHAKDEGDYESEIKKMGGKIFRTASRREGFRKNRRDLNDFFRQHPDYKIVHQHVSSASYIEPLKIAKRHGVPVRILHSHNIRQQGILHHLMHHKNRPFLHKIATDFFACSNLAAEWLLPNKLVKLKKYKLINNAIEVDKFMFNQEKREMLRARLGLGDCFVIGHIGRFSPQKNHHFLLDIFTEVYKRDSSSRLLLVGDGILRNEIESIAMERGLFNKIVFAGVTPNVGDYLSAMDSFVLPSKYEGLGLSLIEAQTSGLRCFASKDVVPNEVNVTGLVEFIGLDKPAEYWSETILAQKNYNRSSKATSISKAGYNAKQEAKRLQDWYEIKYDSAHSS